MKVVIDIPEDIYKVLKQKSAFEYFHLSDFVWIDLKKSIQNSIPLPNSFPFPKGRWIPKPPNIELGEREPIWWECSNCGQVIFSTTKEDRLGFHRFCSRCGAKMEKE